MWRQPEEEVLPTLEKLGRIEERLLELFAEMARSCASPDIN
jgi:hypothetical protein